MNRRKCRGTKRTGPALAALPVLALAFAMVGQTGCKKNGRSGGRTQRNAEQATQVMNSEADRSFRSIASAAIDFYDSPRVSRTGMLLDKQFPPSTPMTPKQSCCKSSDLTCHRKDEDWDSPTWQALHFRPDDKHLLQYQFQSCNEKGHEGFLIRAVGSPACNGKHLVFELEVHPSADGRFPTVHELTKRIRRGRTKNPPSAGLACPKTK